jgi:N-acetylmuramoyl-L-alanine amidase
MAPYRPLHRPGAHCNAGHRNFIGIGICLVGNFNQLDEIPEAQLSGLLDKIGSLMAAFHLSLEDVELHRDVPGAATECPGRYFPEDVLREELVARFG